MDVGEEIVLLTASHTHLFPGARLRSEEPTSLDKPGVVTLLIVFSDASTSAGLLEPRPDGADHTCRLTVEAYTTAAGTAVTARSWRADVQAAPGPATLVRVLDRLDP